jgi:hypothetical protein
MNPPMYELSPTLTAAQLLALLHTSVTQSQSGASSYVIVLHSRGVAGFNGLKLLREFCSVSNAGVRKIWSAVPTELMPILSSEEGAAWIERFTDVGLTAYLKPFSWTHDLSLCCAIAQHSNLSSELVRYLLLSREPLIIERLAQSPHLPQEMLSTLARRHPRAFLQNPLLPLLLLESPTLALLDGDALVELIKQEGALPLLYPAALSRKEPSAALAEGDLEALPHEILVALSRTSFSSVQASLINNDKTPVWVLEVLSELVDEVLASEIIEHPNVTDSLLRRLCEHPSQEVRAEAAEQLQKRA